VLLLRAVGRRSDAIAASGVMWRATQSEDQAVRIAALEALGKVAGAATVDTLAQAAAEAGGVEKEVARRSLRLLEGEGVDEKLMRSILLGDAQRRVEMIRALAGRGVAAAVSRLVEAARDNDGSVRQEAIRALGMLADESDLGPIVALAVNPIAPDDRPALVEALGKTFLRIDDKSSCAKPVLAALAKAPAEAKPALVLLLGKTGSADALPVVREALGSTDPAMQDAAVRALSQWPDAAASDDLIELVATAQSQKHKELALEGYVRMTTMSDDPTAMYLRVIRRVERVNDKKRVLEGLGMKSEAPEALQLALDHLDDENLQAAAGLAALRIAHRLRTRDEKLARAALHKVLEAVDHEDVHQRAQEVLNDLDKYQDHILRWVAAGPFTEKGKEGAAIYATPFAPEKTDAEGVEWKPITKGIGSWEINLEATFGGLDYCAAYLKTRVWSEIEQDAQLELGSDDGIKAWLGGQVVFDRWKEGSVAPRQARVKIRLAEGWNELMLKVVDQRGGWVGACRIRKPDGTALEGLKIEAP
jgi:HEAT repeat protein